MFGFSQKLAAIAAGSVTAVAAVAVPAQAITAFSFEVELTEAVEGVDTFAGSFSFEEDFGIVDGGVEIFDLTSFDFDFLGESFDISSDSRVTSLSGFPTVSFDIASGEILGVDFFTEPFLPGTFFSFVPEDLVGVIQDSEFEFTTASIAGSGDVSFEPIPEPATVIGLIAIGMGGLFVRKQQA